VTSANAIDPADPKKVTLNDKLTVIDLQSSPPQATATLTAGKGAAGVSINRAGKLALVANRSEGTVSVFTIDGKTLTPAGKIELGDDKSGPSHVVFSHDGKTALVARRRQQDLGAVGRRRKGHICKARPLGRRSPLQH
jgi:DNA-binding beta-propeller fold protein YncE